MLALIRYALASLIHSQRYLAPALLYLVVLATFTINDQGTLAGVYVVSAGALLVCGTWLTVTIVNLDDPVQRAITVSAAGRSRRVLAASVGLAVLVCVVLAGVGLVFPLLSGHHVITSAGLVTGAEAELACAFAGIAVGLLCSRLVVGRPGYSLILALGLVLALPLVRIPPINPMLRSMSGDGPAGHLVLPIAADLTVCVILSLASALVTQYFAVRRD
ncbi:hypothetical protein GCM10023322_28530 [Rugosimonospora acidiphila]|uniref:ABC transporter permease n=1 Tax=Rugosimonospora acidiphila TaxID=556531 RepID=A0ABP9RT10_9ACTN